MIQETSFWGLMMFIPVAFQNKSCIKDIWT